MKKYKITVTRVSYSDANFIVDADNLEQAKGMAIQEAYDYSYKSEDDSDYQIYDYQQIND